MSYQINPRYEINKIIKSQTTVTTSKLKKLFKLYEERNAARIQTYKDRVRELETTITNQRRELRRLRND